MAFDEENVTCCVVSPLLQRSSQQKSNTRTDLDTIPVFVLAAGHEKFAKYCQVLEVWHNAMQGPCITMITVHIPIEFLEQMFGIGLTWVGVEVFLDQTPPTTCHEQLIHPPTERDRQERSNLTRQQWRSSFMVMLLLHSWGYLTQNGLLACMAGLMYGQPYNCIDLLPPLLFWG